MFLYNICFELYGEIRVYQSSEILLPFYCLISLYGAKLSYLTFLFDQWQFFLRCLTVVYNQNVFAIDIS